MLRAPLTLLAILLSLGATAQLAHKFNLALTTKNVWLSPTLTYDASPTTSLELTLPLNSTLFLDDALGGLGIYSFYSELKYVRTLPRRANLQVSRSSSSSMATPEASASHPRSFPPASASAKPSILAPFPSGPNSNSPSPAISTAPPAAWAQAPPGSTTTSTEPGQASV